jgi:hypothetical protein
MSLRMYSKWKSFLHSESSKQQAVPPTHVDDRGKIEEEDEEEESEEGTTLYGSDHDTMGGASDQEYSDTESSDGGSTVVDDEFELDSTCVAWRAYALEQEPIAKETKRQGV